MSLWIFDILSNNQSRATLGSGNVSHRRTSAFDDPFDHCVDVLKKCTTEHYGEKQVLRSKRRNQTHSKQLFGVGSFHFVRIL